MVGLLGEKDWSIQGLLLTTLDAGLLAISQYSEGPATGHLGTGFFCFPCVYKQMLRWFPRLQVATACFSCSPPELNFLDPYFIFMYVHYNHCHRVTAYLQLYYYYYYIERVRGGAFGRGTMLQVGSLRVRFLMKSLKFPH